MEVLAALAFRVVDTHLAEDLAGQVQTEGCFTRVQLSQHFSLAALATELLVPRLSQSNLLEDPDEELVDVVLNAT